MVQPDSIPFIDSMMKRKANCLKIAVVIFCFPVFILSECLLSAQPVTNAENNSEKREKYRYEAVPEGSRKASRKKFIEMNINSAESRTIFTMKSVSAKEVEYIRLELDADSSFVSGIRNVTHPSGKPKSESTILRKQQTVYVKRVSGKKKKAREYNLPKKKSFVVDGSLLLLLRSFPFNQNKELKLFMIDFSQNSVSGVVRQAGVETIRVKAGEFECYRMELIVHAFVFRPKITYWISKRKPHFLVKHRGKIGPFTRTYVTQLVSIE
jgi:hypothetical protein